MDRPRRPRVLVIGGGCYGTYHAGQLLKATRAGRLDATLVVADHNPACRARTILAGGAEVEFRQAEWDVALAAFLAEAGAGDHVVPAPFSPHLLWSWLAAELGAARVPAPGGWALPFEAGGADGEVYVSAAAWRCPAACVEPAHCPVLHAPRDWDLAEILEAGARQRGLEPAVLRAHHLAAGIATVPVAALLEARDRLRERPGPALVATASHCHAALGALAPSPAR